jgi:hypothetical protein
VPLLGPDLEFARRFIAMERNLLALVMQSALVSASSDGPNGSMSIIADAVNSQPAIQFTYTGGGGSLLAQLYQTTAGAIQITGGLQVSGTKNFVMNHPTKPGWTLRHASTESPVNGVEYWGEGVLGADGTAVVTLPEYFEALTSPDHRIVQLTAIGAPTSLAYDRITGGAFTVRGVSGTPFSWLVKAERVSHPEDWPIDFLTEEEGTVASPAESSTALADALDGTAPPDPVVVTSPDYTYPAP